MCIFAVDMKLITALILGVMPLSLMAQFFTLGPPGLPKHLQNRKIIEDPPPQEDVDLIVQDTADVEDDAIVILPDSSIKCHPPLSGTINISSAYGYRRNPFSKTGREFHSGLDLAAKKGTPVFAVMPGVIVGVGYDGRAGNYIKIRHGAFTISYCHLLRKPQLPIGLMLFGGDAIAHVGSTGRSTGPHLHITIKREGKNINPELFLNHFGLIEKK